MNTTTSSVTRRSFVKSTSTAAALAAVSPGVFGAASKRPLKSALIGTGGRGTGAANDHLQAAKELGVDLRLVMLGDVFEDRLERSIATLKSNAGVEISRGQCVLGFDGYKKVMDADVDIVLLTTPPNFRPVHLAAAVAAGKHVFVEKPVGVDPVGCRSVMATGKVAAEKKLSIVAGTQRRHEPGYLAVAKAVKEGAIGKIMGGTIHFCLGGGSIGKKPEGMSDADWLIRSWGGWAEMCGDHIVEQHVHSIDVMNWFLGGPPINCVSFGHRARRKNGNCYDFFSTDYEFPGGVHIHSMARQVTETWSRIGQFFRGDKGIADVTGLVYADRVYVGGADRKSPVDLGKWERTPTSYVREHMALIRSILDGNPINEAHTIAESSLTAVMGRISAYNGQMVTWEEMMTSSFRCSPNPDDFESGTVKLPAEEPTIPGKG
ncbi:MAG: Gfo/Idh/MocA family oxidoreductase [Verrucomicrobiales bacterium]|nr:Gfo/Idh/MocA family oxidoreductase [Verrucomicrobiales bacterium]